MDREITKSIIVRGQAEDIYRIWSDVENLPRFMKHLVSVRSLGDGLSHWVARGPLGITTEWDVETTTVEPNKRIGWMCRGQGDVLTTGQVTFNQLPEDQTELTVTMKLAPRSGRLVGGLLNLFASPASMLDDDLRAFKQHVERKLEVQALRDRAD